MSDTRSKDRYFNLDAMERSHWRSRINQLKRELRSSSARGEASTNQYYETRSAAAAARSASPNAGSRRPSRRRGPRRVSSNVGRTSTGRGTGRSNMSRTRVRAS
ncbi:MAG: hypothetical protein VKJ85_05565 [Prochlorothrix sp.]|nr:hypothetical protein [Prochlorothrix sp.]